MDSKPATSSRRPLIICLGSRGFTQTGIRIAEAMQEVGWSPLLVALPVFKALVETHRVPYANIIHVNDCSLDFADSLVPSQAHNNAWLYSFYAKYAEGMLAKICRLARDHRADVLLINQTIFFSEYLRQTLRLPVVQCYTYPVRWTSSTQSRSGNISVDFREANAQLDGDFVAARAVPTDLHLLNFPSTFSKTHFPGIDGVHTGVLVGTHTSADEPLSQELDAFMRAGTPPVCVNFGSVPVYATPWVESLLSVLETLVRHGEIRLLAIGKTVPAELSKWNQTMRVQSAPHRQIFPRCACVIHHSSTQTAMATIVAGVPSILVPFIPYIDQPRIAAWMERAGAGIYLRDGQRTRESFLAALRRANGAERVAMCAAASKLRLHVSSYSGAAHTVAAIDAFMRIRASPEAQIAGVSKQVSNSMDPFIRPVLLAIGARANVQPLICMAARAHECVCWKPLLLCGPHHIALARAAGVAAESVFPDSVDVQEAFKLISKAEPEASAALLSEMFKTHGTETLRRTLLFTCQHRANVVLASSTCCTFMRWLRLQLFLPVVQIYHQPAKWQIQEDLAAGSQVNSP
eukprot:2606220-Pleurochrysis_carterae.AAC.2